MPRSHAVDSALQQAVKRLDIVRRRVNSFAAKEMKADQYEVAQKWMEMGRSVADFTQRLEAFAEEWKRLVKATRIVARARSASDAGKPAPGPTRRRTPIWKFSEPALKALAARGGSASLPEILEDLGQDPSVALTDRDRAESSGIPLWHKAVKQAYKQCQREGWIEKRRDGVWKITPAGGALGQVGRSS
jgi:hypothetical protein